MKRELLAQVESLGREPMIFASNTSSIPIAAIAEGSRRPANVIGMHYFSPVPKMPLLEIVVAERTASWAAATAHAFGTAQGLQCGRDPRSALDHLGEQGQPNGDHHAVLR